MLLYTFPSVSEFSLIEYKKCTVFFSEKRVAVLSGKFHRSMCVDYFTHVCIRIHHTGPEISSVRLAREC